MLSCLNDPFLQWLRDTATEVGYNFIILLFSTERVFFLSSLSLKYRDCGGGFCLVSWLVCQWVSEVDLGFL